MGEHLCPGTLDHPDRCQESWFGESSLKVCSGSFMPSGHIPRPNCLTSHTNKYTGPGCCQEGFRLQTARDRSLGSPPLVLARRPSQAPLGGLGLLSPAREDVSLSDSHLGFHRVLVGLHL